MQDKTATVTTILFLVMGCGDSDPGKESTSSEETTSAVSTSTTSEESSEPTQGSEEGLETSSTTESSAICGNAVVEPGEQCDDGAQNSDEAACKLDCNNNVCGDGAVLKDAEACDDGNFEAGDGCDAVCQAEAIPLCPPGTINRLLNPGFEDGVLAPWQSQGAASAITENPHSAMWSARIDGNAYLQQDLPEAIPVAQINRASFWSWHDISDEPAMLVEWVYDDLVVESVVIAGTLDGWQSHDILENFDLAKSILGFRVWGYFSDLPKLDVAVFDDFALCINR